MGPLTAISTAIFKKIRENKNNNYKFQRPASVAAVTVAEMIWAIVWEWVLVNHFRHFMQRGHCC